MIIHSKLDANLNEQYEYDVVPTYPNAQTYQCEKRKNETSTSTPEVAKRSFSDTRVLT